jgi:hypothetical protein
MNSFDLWLRRQVLKLEHEISTNPVFDGDLVPTRDELMELRRLTVIHRFLNGNLQQLESRNQPAPGPLRKARTDETDLREALSTSASR